MTTCTCGHIFRTNFSPVQQPPSPPVPAPDSQYRPAISHDCPVCGNHDIQKISALVGHGAWATNTKGYSIGAGHVMGGPNFVTGSINRGHSVSATGLAQMLAAPSAPIKKTCQYFGTIIGAVLSVICFMILVASIGAKSFAAASISGGIFVLFLVFMVWAYLQDRNQEGKYVVEHQHAMQRWQVAIQNWEKLYYCGKCDHVHDAVSRRAVPPASIDFLL